MIILLAAAVFQAHAEHPYEIDWLLQEGTVRSDYAHGAAVDQDGFVYTVGRTLGDYFSSGGGVLDLYLTKRTPSGELVWGRQIGGPLSSSAAIGFGVSVDPFGDIVIAGRSSGTLFQPIDEDIAPWDGVIAKYNSDGQMQWGLRTGTGGREELLGVSTDALGNIYAAGYTSGDYAKPNLGPLGQYDGMLVKLDPQGNELWRAQVGTEAREWIRGVAATPDGGVVVTGFTYGDLEQEVLGSSDIFVTRYAADGTKQWGLQYGTEHGEEGVAIDVDAAGNAYVTGFTTGDLAAEAVGGDLFISKIDTSGQIAWSRQFGAGPEHWLEVGRAITVDEDGNAFIAGYTQGELGDDYAGGQDMVVVKFDTDGTMGWTKQFGTASDDDLYGITLGNNGELYAVGVSNGQFPGAVYSGTGPVIVKLIDNESIPGDANGDGQVTAADLVILDANFGQAGTFIDGDFNGDGTVTAADLVILDANFGAGVGSVTSTSTIAAIPVPSSLALLGFGGVLLLRRRGS